MQNKKQPSGKFVDQSLSGCEEEKEIETEKVLSKNCLNENISFNTSDIKDNTSTPKVKKVRVKKSKKFKINCYPVKYATINVKRKSLQKIICSPSTQVMSVKSARRNYHQLQSCSNMWQTITMRFKGMYKKKSKEDTTENIEANSINKKEDHGIKDKEKSFVFSES